MNFVLFCLSLITILAQNGLCDKTSEKIYYDVTTFAMCFRRMNGTHQVGCTSERGGNVGILHYIEDDAEVDWLIQNSIHKPYVVMMSPITFNRVNVDKLRKVDGLLSGILVEHVNLTTTDLPGAFSPDSTCPNEEHGMYKEYTDYKDCRMQEWNPFGNSLMYEDYNFPIVALVNYTEVQFLKDDCYNKFNNRTEQGYIPDYPLCAVEVKDAMDGAKDSPTCIRRSNLVLNLNPDRYCDPLGDYTVFGFNRLLNNSETVPNDSVIVAAARLDAFSLFDNVYPGADSAISGIVTLLAAAQALTRASHSGRLDKPIIYSFFNGEAFDYIGSSRMVYEMKKNRFPYNIDPKKTKGPSKVGLNNLDVFVEVSQIGLADTDTYYAHIDPVSNKDPDVSSQVESMIEDLKDLTAGTGVTINKAEADIPLPPASSQIFLKGRIHLPVIVLADHEKEYNNTYYNSRYDLATFMDVVYNDSSNASEKYDTETEGSKRLCDVSTLLARFLYKRSTGQDPGDDIKAECMTVSHLLYCMLISPQCELFKEVLDSMDNIKKLASVPYPLYVGVSNGGRNQMTLLTRNLLAYFTGQQVLDATKSDCDKLDDTPLSDDRWLDHLLMVVNVIWIWAI